LYTFFCGGKLVASLPGRLLPYYLRSRTLHEKIVRFLSIDGTKLAIFLVFSFIALMFFASIAAFLWPAVLVGGLYYFFLLEVFQVPSQLLGLDYHPPLADTTFLVTLATTVMGYFYLLASYITHVARRKMDLANMLMILSLVLVFISPFVILSYQPAPSTGAVVHYDIADGESCVGVPVSGAPMEWDQGRRTCHMRGSFIVGGGDEIRIAGDVTLEILSGGNLTTTRLISNNGTLVVNGGILKNNEGYIYNNGVIFHRNGTFVNSGIIENGRDFGGAVAAKNLPAPRIVNEATIENNYYIYNYANFTNRGLVDNKGQAQFFDESVAINAGTISNKGRINMAGEFDNEGGISNSGTIVIYRHFGPITGGVVTVLDNFGEIENTVGEIYNLGTINNHGRISNDVGRFVNRLDEDKAIINNEGVISNVAGEFLNDGIIANSCSGVIDGEIQNSLPADVCDR
jgi:hypothetical protein